MLEVLPVSGVAVSTMGGGLYNDTVCATDGVAFRIDEIQFDLGEGPCWEAFASQQPVSIPDLYVGSHDRWPVFIDAVRATDARALFAFPLSVGAITVGTMDLYRTQTGPLEPDSVYDCRILADTVATELVHRIIADLDGGADGVDGIPSWCEHVQNRRTIHQATGILMEQLDLSVGAAYARLQGHAFATGARMADVAVAVADHRLHLTRDTL